MIILKTRVSGINGSEKTTAIKNSKDTLMFSHELQNIQD